MSDAASLRTDYRTYTPDQLQGWACALCAARLFADRLVGSVDVPTGYRRIWKAPLYACSPECVPPRQPWLKNSKTESERFTRTGESTFGSVAP